MSSKNKNILDYLLAFVVLPTCILVFFIYAPWIHIFTWVVFIIGLPLLWDRYKGGPVLNFWKSFIKFAGKIGATLFMLLLIRACFTKMGVFAPFETWADLTTTTGGTMMFGFPADKVLYDLIFLVIVGMIVVETIFKGKKYKISAAVIGSFLGLFFFFSTFGNVFGDATRASTKHMATEELIPAFENNGIVGGLSRQLWAVAFGKPTASKKTTWSETITLNRSGQQEATKRLIKPGEYVIFEVEFNPVAKDRGDGSKETLLPGKYRRQYNKGGVAHFYSLGDFTSRVTVGPG